MTGVCAFAKTSRLADDAGARAALAARGRAMAMERLGDAPLREALRGIGFGVAA